MDLLGAVFNIEPFMLIHTIKNSTITHPDNIMTNPIVWSRKSIVHCDFVCSNMIKHVVRMINLQFMVIVNK